MKGKRILSAIVLLAMVFSTIGFTAFADEPANSGVAKIGDVYYESVLAAVDAATDGAEIDLLGNTFIVKDVLPSKSLVLRDRDLTFKNGTFDLTDFGTPTDSTNAIFDICNGSNITFDKVTFNGSNYCSAFGIIYIHGELGYVGTDVETVTLNECNFDLKNDGRIEGGILKGDSDKAVRGKFVIKKCDFKGENIISAIKNTDVEIEDTTFDFKCTRTEIGTFRNHAFRGVKGTVKNSAIKADGFETGFKANALTVENTDISLTNSNNGDNVVSCTDLVLKSGNFTFDPTAYLEDGKVAVKSEKEGYLFTIGDKNANITVDVTIKTEAPSVDTSNVENITSAAVDAAAAANNNAATNDVLRSEATGIKNNEKEVASSAVEAAVTELQGGDPTVDVSVVVVPKLEMEVTAVETDGDDKTVELKIEATYDIVATTDASNITADNSKKVGESKKLDVTKPVDITIPLPDGFAAAGSKIYIKHIKDNGNVFIYEATVAADGKTATFTNPNGFSTFIASTATPAASIGEALYETLSAAVKAVKNNETIKLNKDNAENVTVARTVIFTLDKNGASFTGSIKAGAYTKLTQDGDEYTFEYSRPYIGGSTGGGSSVATYTVKFNTNGGSEIDSVKVAKNKAVSEPKAPTKDGFEFAGWYTDKALETKYDFSDKVTENITLYAAWTEIEKDDTDKPAESEFVFTDVNDGDWFFENVKYVSENCLMNGMTDTTFEPNNNLTRAMLVTILYRAEGEPAVNRSIPFADVTMDKYYANAVIWAQQNAIVAGMTENEFAPDLNITREQIATIIYRYASYKGYDISVGENTNILSYADYDEISEYAIEAMQYAVGAGLIKGKTDSTVNPKDNATRAEIAAILNRFIEGNK